MPLVVLGSVWSRVHIPLSTGQSDRWQRWGAQWETEIAVQGLIETIHPTNGEAITSPLPRSLNFYPSFPSATEQYREGHEESRVGCYRVAEEGGDEFR